MTWSYLYQGWDAHILWWLMGQGAEAYIPPKHYGEHGGLLLPNAGSISYWKGSPIASIRN